MKFVLIVGALAAFAASCLQPSAKIPVTTTSSERPPPIAEKASDKTFEKFSHRIPEHKEFECSSCHQREGRSLDMEFAGHDSCIGCHLNQFTDQNQTMCAICHQDLKASEPTMKPFPATFREGFNMKFDHAAHDNGAGRPPEGCSSCHAPSGAGRSIPAGFRAHNNCYVCHTPERKIGSCSTCHELAPYSRTPQSRYVFNAVFSHNEHAGVSCSDCHEVRAGAGQGRQVTSIAASQHCPPANNCASCHNGSRAFSGDDMLNMASCLKCHPGTSFDMLPGGPCRN